MTNAPPSHSAASEGSLSGGLGEIYRKFLQSTDDMLPAVVVSYDRATNRAQVRPFIAIKTTTGATIAREDIPGVPVFQMGGGDFLISFNLIPGDRGWLKANDRDISLFLQSFGESAPNTKRLHKFSDAMFFPDVMTGYTIASEDAQSAVIQNREGTVKIALSASGIKYTAPVHEFVGPVIMGSTLDVAGVVTSDAEVQVGAIGLTTHKHPGVQAGGDESGAAIP